MVSTLAFAGIAEASGNNPFGLVYKEPITENVKGKVNIHPVTYMLNGLKIAANVYTPAGYDDAQKYPAVAEADFPTPSAPLPNCSPTPGFYETAIRFPETAWSRRNPRSRHG